MMFEIAGGIVLAVIVLGLITVVGELLESLWYKYTDPRR